MYGQLYLRACPTSYSETSGIDVEWRNQYITVNLFSAQRGGGCQELLSKGVQNISPSFHNRTQAVNHNNQGVPTNLELSHLIYENLTSHYGCVCWIQSPVLPGQLCPC